MSSFDPHRRRERHNANRTGAIKDGSVKKAMPVACDPYEPVHRARTAKAKRRRRVDANAATFAPLLKRMETVK